MFPEFESYLRSQTTVTREELQLICSKAVERKLRRKEAILQEGEICRYKTFISSGILRTYRTREEGSEHILQFMPEDTWAVDPESYNEEVRSNYFIDALEDSKILQWAKADFVALLNNIPAFKNFSEKIISANIYLNRQRVFSSISSTAEEKYDEFIQSYPGLFARVPLHMVASYLGVTRETLSRIRHAQTKRD
ncbi:Crp/Fnr family transcriptional regulator [Ferruginibacter sp. HRS2-29]|uniref:Crp/Fnr family transcriptional regulator n=1 Tax=Ferruginibacter sp. HRS2-29 TaxID=2487334 RepID=UPI0020CD26C1|nr:Crp/Fnr family transcriptional regulator [Ferruginibacter sp. HRS2-29]MCP9750180.1 Crp/Fnr family transcriptional regulator [Ferruginibacter sp. HRS2-29]